MKTFFIFKENEKGDPSILIDAFHGTIGGAREGLKASEYQAGAYRILEDTSGQITKEIATRQDVKINFSTRKRAPRKSVAKAAKAAK